MKIRKSFWQSLVFFGATLILIGCGEIGNNGGFGNNIPENRPLNNESKNSLSPTQSFTVAELAEAIRRKESFRLANGVQMRPTRIDSLGKNQEIYLQFQPLAPIKGFTLYVYSSSPIEIGYDHPDLLFLAGAQNAPAAKELSNELGFEAPHSQMIGGVLNKETTDIGGLIIKASATSSLRFYAEIPE